MTALYRDRHQAGRLLAARLWGLAGQRDARIVGLVRGGVPVAFEVAMALGLPLHVISVRKLASARAPGRIFGAVAHGGSAAIDGQALRESGVGPEAAGEVAAREAKALARMSFTLGGPPLSDVHDQVAVLVDDGIASGLSARAAARALRDFGARRIVVAAPVASTAAREALAQEVDAWVVPAELDPFGVVSNWYEHFPTVSDCDIREMLGRAAHREEARPARPR
jgi:putative phosphoribosyl transferase